MRFNLKTIALATVCALTSMSAAADDISTRRPAQHNAEHKDLLAYQTNVTEQIKLKETLDYMDNMFKEEEEPELDIYTEGWDSQLVNAYTNSVVPDSKVIDVTNFAMPTPGYVTSPYGYRRRFRRMHKGIDLKVQIGDTIRAAFDGKVRLTRYERRGYGYYVIVRHENGLETVYGHLSRFLVKPDDYVKAGDPIALGGNTGRSTGSHLHFETRFLGIAINPIYMFDFPKQDIVADTYTFRRTQGSKRAGSHDTQVADGTIRYHKVKSGDTLSRIAKLRGVSVSTLCKLNRIKPTTTLRIGQVLRCS